MPRAPRRTRSEVTPGPAPSGLRGRTARGFLWSGGATVIGLAVQLAYTAAMGRLVSPTAFGLIAAAGVLISVVKLVSGFGLGSAVVQRENVDGSDVRCAFTYSVLFGLSSTVIVVVLSEAAAQLLGSAQLTPLIRVMALGLFVVSFGSIAEASLRRAMRYRALATLDLSSMTFGFLFVGVPLAIAGAAEWSLLCAQLTYSLLYTVGLLLVVRHSLRPIFAWSRARRFVLFGGGVSLLSLFEYAGSNLDTIGVSRYLGPAQLGQYSRATLLFSLPAYRVTVAFTTVLFPAVARVQASMERVRDVLQHSLGGLSMAVLPASIVAGLAAPALTRVVLGPSWGAAAEVLPLLALASALALLTHVISLTFEAIGRLREKFVIQAFRVVVLIAMLGVVLLIGPSLVRFAAAWLLVQVVEYLAYVVAARVRIGCSLSVIALQMVRALTTGVVCGMPAFLIVRVAAQDGMLGFALAGLGAFAVFMALWRTPMLADTRNVLDMLKEGMRPPRGPEFPSAVAGAAGHAYEVAPMAEDPPGFERSQAEPLTGPARTTEEDAKPRCSRDPGSKR